MISWFEVNGNNGSILIAIGSLSAKIPRAQMEKTVRAITLSEVRCLLEEKIGKEPKVIVIDLYIFYIFLISFMVDMFVNELVGGPTPRILEVWPGTSMREFGNWINIL